MKTVIFSVALLIPATLSLGAKTIKWPEKNSAFSITLPDGWTCKIDNDGDLQCKAEDNSGLGFQVVTSQWKTEEEIRAQLPSLGEKIAGATNLKNVEKGKIRETTTSGDVKLLRLDTAGLQEGVGLVCWMVAFKTDNNPYFLLSGAMAKDNREHEKRIGQIINSITPVVTEDSAKRKTGDFDPYKGALVSLLPAEFSNTELSSLGIKFKQTSTSVRTLSWKRQGASEAVRFSYNLVSIVIVKIEGELVNFETSSHAVAALKAMAAEKGGTIAPKGDGQRFSAQNGQIIGWTNGSLMCVVIGGTDPAAGNFEKAAPF